MRGRIGYAAGPLAALRHRRVGLCRRALRQHARRSATIEKHINIRLGWAAGAGVEYAFAPHWSVRLEYLYSRFENADIRFPPARNTPRRWISSRCASASTARSTGPDRQSRAEDRADRSGIRSLGNPRPDHLSAAGLSGVPRALYRHQQPDAGAAGAGDLEQQPVPERAALGRRRGLLQSRTAAGIRIERHRRRRRDFPTAKRRNRTSPTRTTTPRGCSCARPSASAASRKSWRAARPSSPARSMSPASRCRPANSPSLDVFDGNAYAKDTRKDFMNWSMWAPGAFDYSADKVGLTYGATAELNQKHWALRAGYFLMRRRVRTPTTSTPGSSSAAPMSLELETRYSLFSQPGKLRTIAWLNSAYSGSYRETLDNPALNLDIAQTRDGPHQIRLRLQPRAGLDRRVGLFGRWSWNDGKTEIMAFTDIDATLSLGLSIKGTKWGRPDDVIGIGGAINALSRDHRDFIAAGGLGVLIGDGAAQLPARANSRNLLRLRAQQGADADRGLPVHHQPRLQRRPRPGARLLRALSRRILRRVQSSSRRIADDPLRSPVTDISRSA